MKDFLFYAAFAILILLTLTQGFKAGSELILAWAKRRKRREIIKLNVARAELAEARKAKFQTQMHYEIEKDAIAGKSAKRNLN